MQAPPLPYDPKNDEARRNREELFQLLMQDLTQVDRDNYIETLNGLEHNNVKISEDKVRECMDQIARYYDKVVADDFEFLDDWWNLLFYRKTYMTFFVKTACMIIFEDLKLDTNKMNEDKEGKDWKWVWDDCNTKFDDCDHDFESLDTTIKIMEQLNKGKNCKEIMDMKL